ncbi:MAG: hypothetical protein M3Q45_07155 [Chloroflexota bacterium]|nr:hypothetical protein [Chloroflexota bacterium]
MTTNPTPIDFNRPGGFATFLADVERCVAAAAPGWTGTQQFVCAISDCYAFIRLQDLRHPVRFLRQAAGDPPMQFGTDGFNPTIVDDKNPARHYTAFVFVGFWLPLILAVLVLWLWEILGFLRYGFRWSANDIRCGYVGIRHGRQVRRGGPGVLPALVRRDLAA